MSSQPVVDPGFGGRRGAPPSRSSPEFLLQQWRGGSHLGQGQRVPAEPILGRYGYPRNASPENIWNDGLPAEEAAGAGDELDFVAPAGHVRPSRKQGARTIFSGR